MPFFYIIYVVICVLVIGLILFQDGKTGGLVSVADNNTVFGAKGATSFLTKLTAIMVGLFFVMDLGLAYYGGPNRSVAADHAASQGAGEITSTQQDAGTPAPGDVSVDKNGGVEVEADGAFKNATTETFRADDLTPEQREKLGLDKPAAEKKDDNDNGQQQEEKKDE